MIKTVENSESKKNITDSEFLKKQIIMMGGSIDNNKKQISPQEIEKFKKNWIKMYYGFVSVNWGAGMTLGMAWQKALEQMDAYAMSKSKVQNHPINEHMIKFHREFRRDMAKTIMTSEYADYKLPEHLKQKLADYGQKRIRESKSDIDNMYKQYAPEHQDTNRQIISVKFNVANRNVQSMMQQILIQQQMNQRAA